MPETTHTYTLPEIKEIFAKMHNVTVDNVSVDYDDHPGSGGLPVLRGIRVTEDSRKSTNAPPLPYSNWNDAAGDWRTGYPRPDSGGGSSW